MMLPVTITLRQLLQETWMKKLDWDEQLPDEIRVKAEKAIANTQNMYELPIPRCIFFKTSPSKIYIFCDASEKCYGACAYHVGGDEQAAQLMFARARLAPTKRITVPRLELLAALLGARMSDFVRRQMKCNNIMAFSDSQIVLSWIKNDFVKFVFSKTFSFKQQVS